MGKVFTSLHEYYHEFPLHHAALSPGHVWCFCQGISLQYYCILRIAEPFPHSIAEPSLTTTISYRSAVLLKLSLTVLTYMKFFGNLRTAASRSLNLYFSDNGSIIFFSMSIKYNNINSQVLHSITKKQQLSPRSHYRPIIYTGVIFIYCWFFFQFMYCFITLFPEYGNTDFSHNQW